ncbi:MAG: A24 family peptidase [Anaerolineales bacterium]|nr:A24 family peptidase [Anaerolineales bacterium]
MYSLLLIPILGWAGSSIVNYLADRLPVYRKISPPICPVCNHPLSWQYYGLLGGCKHCDHKPGVRHKVVLFLGIFLSLLLVFFPPASLGVYGGLVWLVYFGLIVVIDVEHRLILHPVSLAGAVLGLIFGTLNHGILPTIIGGAAGFGIMLVLYFLGELFVRFLAKSRGEEIDEVALGFGDVNLAGVIGLLLGWPGITAGLILAILIGGIVSGIFLVIQVIRKKYNAFQALPYGPFIVLSAVLLLFLADKI